MFRRKGQSMMEYAILVACIVAALTLMQHYLKRGLAGRYKDSTDNIGAPFDPAVYRATNIVVSQGSYVNQRTDGATRESETKHLSDQTYTKDILGGETISAWGENEDLYSK